MQLLACKINERSTHREEGNNNKSDDGEVMTTTSANPSGPVRERCAARKRTKTSSISTLTRIFPNEIALSFLTTNQAAERKLSRRAPDRSFWLDGYNSRWRKKDLGSIPKQVLVTLSHDKACDKRKIGRVCRPYLTGRSLHLSKRRRRRRPAASRVGKFDCKKWEGSSKVCMTQVWFPDCPRRTIRSLRMKTNDSAQRSVLV